MSQPYIGEIRMFSGNFAPVGWAFCDGQMLAIVDNDALFNLIGTTYGGDGVQTFALPDLRGRVPVHQGSGYVIGSQFGVEAVTLTVLQLPAHIHVPQVRSTSGNQSSPSGNVWAGSALNQFSSNTANVGFASAGNAVGVCGGSQPHDNMAPFLAINFILSLFGVFPSQG